MSFLDATTRRVVSLGTKSKGSTNPISFELPRTGYLSKIWLEITGEVTGTLSAPNAFGMASAVRRVKLLANNGLDLHNYSGPGYHYALREHIDEYHDPVPFSNAKDAVTATTFNLSMLMPIAFNTRDPLGYINLQSEETTLTLQVEFEADAVVATGATVAADVTPVIEYFEVPARPEDRLTPQQLSTVYAILEDDRVIAGAGQYDYAWPRGYTYLALHHIFGATAAGGADNWTRAQMVVQQSDVIEDHTPGFQNAQFSDLHNGGTRELGTINIDRVGSSGLGMYASWRDQVDVRSATDIMTRLQLTGAGTLKTLRRTALSFLPTGK